MGQATGDGRRETLRSDPGLVTGCVARYFESVFGFRLLLIILGFTLGLAACSAPADSEQLQVASPQSSIASSTPSPLPPATQTPTLTSSPTPLPPTPTPCPPDVCAYAGHFYLMRPIAPSGGDTSMGDAVDPTYRYGSTQAGLRKTHHGVEFVNPQGTPVLAAADGVIIVAGNDYQTPYADLPGFYGNLVIIEHSFSGIEQPIYTLYGHLHEIHVETGQQVKAGVPIGTVGFTGWAIGEHLHFEVRYGENSYRKTRNPELWLQPHNDGDGEPHGVIAGLILDEFGSPIPVASISIEHLAPDSDESLSNYYLESYADWTVNGDNMLQENFVIGDIQAGKYRVSFVARGLQIYEVDVLPGQVTMIVFDARELDE